MDRGMRIMLSLAIAIIYPLVVFFTVMTVVPRSDKSALPRYPSCQRQTYDYTTRSYSTNYSCEQEYRAYDQAFQDYSQNLLDDDEKNTTRAVIGLVIALITVAGALLLRDVKELMAGLCAGATVVIVTAATIVITQDVNDIAAGNVLLVLFSFVILTIILYVTEQSFMHKATKPAALPTVPPTIPPTQP